MSKRPKSDFLDAMSGRFKEGLGDRQLMDVHFLLFICNVQNEPRFWRVQGRPNSDFGQIGGRRIGREVDNRNPWENGVHKTHPRALLILRYFLAPRYKVQSRFQIFFFVSPILLPPQSLLRYTLMSSVTSHTALSERPERSRNAKAQARHRAKRKAYIDQVSHCVLQLVPFTVLTIPQLEQTVTKLQIAVGYTTEQVSALPPPLLKIRELEQDNARLQKENDELRRLLQPDSRTDASRRTGVATYQDPRTCDRDYNLKRRKAQDGVYIVCSIVHLAVYFTLMRLL